MQLGDLEALHISQFIAFAICAYSIYAQQYIKSNGKGSYYTILSTQFTVHLA